MLQFFASITLIFHLIIFSDLSIFKDDYPLRVLRDVRLVRDQHERDPTFAI